MMKGRGTGKEVSM
jgi:hypothetical protein